MGAKHTIGVMLAVGWAVALMGETVNASSAGPAARTAAGMSRDTWIHTRLREARRALTASSAGPTLYTIANPDARERAARALVAHWAIETGWGEYEEGYGIAGVRAGPGWTGATRVGSRTGATYRAYPDLASAIADALSIYTRAPYATAWLDLISDRQPLRPRPDDNRGDPRAWYAAILRAGWHPYTDAAAEEFSRVLALVQLAAARETPTP